jgi:hypothetical protein
MASERDLEKMILDALLKSTSAAKERNFPLPYHVTVTDSRGMISWEKKIERPEVYKPEQWHHRIEMNCPFGLHPPWRMILTASDGQTWECRIQFPE